MDARTVDEIRAVYDLGNPRRLLRECPVCRGLFFEDETHSCLLGKKEKVMDSGYRAFLATAFDNESGDVVIDLQVVVAKSADVARMIVARLLDEDVDLDAVSIVVNPFG